MSLRCFTKKLKKYYHKQRPVSGFSNVCIHDNAPTHTSGLVKQCLSRRKLPFWLTHHHFRILLNVTVSCF